MFTGIIEDLGEVIDIKKSGSNVDLLIKSEISPELKVDQSVCHNGICLTVTGVNHDQHSVTAVRETLSKSNLGDLAVGDKLNLERCMVANGRFDGHIVQGHVDQKGTCERVEALDGSWLYDFSFDPSLGNITVEKGSITINGVSLTCFNSGEGKFTVTIIPYTYKHTNFSNIKAGDQVNLEFDIIGKYVSKLLNKS